MTYIILSTRCDVDKQLTIRVNTSREYFLQVNVMIDRIHVTR